MANMHETQCCFDIRRSLAFDRHCVSTVKVKTAGSDRLHFSVDLTSGIKRENDRLSPFH